MANFLESFLSSTAAPVTSFMDRYVPDANTIPGAALGGYLAVPSFLLRTGVQAATVVDDAVSRPASTVLQAQTFSNPLYRDGIQFSDFARMWEASRYISPGRAAMTQAFSPGILPGNFLIQAAGNRGNWNNLSFSPGSDYNPYEMGEQATEDAWDNSPLGTVGSMSADLAFQLAAGKGIGSAASVLKRAAGLSTNVRGFRDLQKLDQTLEDQLKWAETAGAEGRRSAQGDLMMDIARSKNYSEIYSNPWLEALTRRGSLRQMELAEILTRVDDPRLVKDILLADRGDAMAIGRLFQAAPDHVWSLADMNSVMRSQFIEGGQWHPSPDQADLIRQTFDAPIARDEFWSTVKSLFMQTGDDVDQSGLITNITRNSDTVPMQGVAGRAQRWLYNANMEARLGTTGMWVDHALGPLGRNSPTTVLLQWVGGRRPIGRVSLSGLRPTEAVDEMLSYSASSRALRGAREVEMPYTRPDGSVGYQAVAMSEWRNAAIQRLAQAKMRGGDTEVALVVRELEGELIEATGRKYGIDPERMAAIRMGIQESRDRSQQNIARDGFFFDEKGNRVEVDPVTRRQLADELALVPLDELDFALRLESTTSFAKRGRGVARVIDAVETPADFVLRFWRTNMLFKPGYTPKNSIGEPAISSLMAHGTILSPDGLLPALNNFAVNRARQVRQAGYAVADRVGMSGLKKSNEELLSLHQKRMVLQRELDEELLFLDRLDSGGLSPAARAAYGTTAVESRKRLERELSDLETMLDDVDPIWREIVEVPSYGELSRRIDDLDAVVSGGDEWVDETLARIDALNAQAASRTTGTIDDIDRRLGGLRERLDELKGSRDDIEGRFETDTVVGTNTIVGGPADMTRPKVAAKGRDYQGTATARQVDSLQKQIDELEARKAQYLEDGFDYRPVFLTQAELNEISRLERLLGLRERYANGDVSLEASVAKLKADRAALRDELFVLEPTARTRKIRLEESIAAIDGTIASQSRKLARKRAKRELARQRKLGGEGDWSARVGDETITARGLYNEGEFGAAVRAEASSGRTNTLTFDPSDYGSTASARWARNGGVGIVQPSDPLYWEELAYIANRQIRGDAFAVQVLEGKSVQEIMAWLRTPQGRKYARGMGWDDAELGSRITGSRKTKLASIDDAEVGPVKSSSSRRMPVIEESEVARNVRLIKQYFPTDEARARLLDDADVTASDLQRILGDDLDGLSPVHSGALTWSNDGKLRRAINNALDAIWRNMAVKPEDRFGRFPYLDRQWRENVAADARFLAEQGMPIDAKTFNNLRAAALARALKDAENTFYNIRRYSNPVFAMRYLVGFPGAYFNSLYRYARLAYRNPGRAYLAANAYEGVYESFGVDADGERVNDWRNAKAIVIPVPEAVQKVVPLDDSIRLSTTTVDYITGKPSFLPHVTMPVATILANKPQANQWIREEFGEAFYETLFPFGEPTYDNQVKAGPVVLDPLFAGWELDLATALSPSDEDFIQAADQLFTHRLAEWEKGGMQGPPPDPEEASRDAASFWFGKAALKFFGIGSMSAQPEGQMMREEWYKIREMYPNDRAKAREVFLSQWGEWAEYYTRSSSKYRVYVPSTVDAFNRLEAHGKLANDLRAIDPEDPWLASIMFWGSEGDWDRAVYNALSTTSLPGDDEPIRGKYTPNEIADYDAAQRSWDKYNAAKAKLDATMIKYGYGRLSPEGDSAWLHQQWSTWLEGFKAAPENRQWLADFSVPDTQKAVKAINALNTLFDNKEFMADAGNYGAYKIAQSYLNQRETALQAYNSAASSEARTSIAEQWDLYVTTNLLPGSSEFAALYTRTLQGRDLS